MQGLGDSGSESDDDYVPSGIEVNNPVEDTSAQQDAPKARPAPPPKPVGLKVGAPILATHIQSQTHASISLMEFLEGDDETDEENEGERTVWDSMPSTELDQQKEVEVVVDPNASSQAANPSPNAAARPLQTRPSTQKFILPPQLAQQEPNENAPSEKKSMASFIDFLREGPPGGPRRPPPGHTQSKSEGGQNKKDQSFLESLSSERPEDAKEKKSFFKSLMSSKSKKPEPAPSSPSRSQPASPAPAPVPTPAPAVSSERADNMSMLDFLASEPPKGKAPPSAPVVKKAATAPRFPPPSTPSPSTAPSTLAANSNDDSMSFLDFLAKTEPSNARKPSPAAAPPKNEKDMSLMDFLAMGPPASPETSKKPLPAQASVRRLPSQRKSATISGEEEDMMEPGAHTSSMPMVPSGFPEASVAEVVQRLINTDAGEESDLRFVLFVNYETICNPEALMALVIDQYKASGGNGKNQERIVDLISHWMTDHWYNFNKAREALVAQMKKCSLDTGLSDRFPFGMRFRNLIVEAEKGPLPLPKERELHIDESVSPSPVLPIAPKGRFGAIHIHPLELARQMTLIDQELWAAIEPWEFYKQGWTKPDKQKLAPNIFNAIVRFNITSRWIQAELLCEEDIKTRILTLKHFLKVAAHLIELNNFNGLLQITSAIMATPVYRLKKTFEGLSEREQTAFDKAMEIVDGEGNYKKLRQVLKTVSMPALPYLGMYLTELIYADEGQYGKASEGKVILKKWARWANVIRKVQKYQQVRYHFIQLPIVNDLILNAEVYDDDVLYKLSTYVEPRGGGEPSGERPPQLRDTEVPKVEGKGIGGMFKKKSTRLGTPALVTPQRSLSVSSMRSADSQQQQQQPQPQQQQQGQPTTTMNHERESSSGSSNPLTASGGAAVVTQADSVSAFRTDAEWFTKFPVTTGSWPWDGQEDTAKLQLTADGSISGGTLAKIIERLSLMAPTSPDIADFINTFTCLVTPKEFFDLLTKRFQVPPLRRGSPPNVEASYQSQVIGPVRHRVLEILSTWIKSYPIDFKAPSPLYTPVTSFLNSVVAPVLGADAISPLLELLEAKDLYPIDGAPLPMMGQLPNKPAGQCSAVDFSPEEIARQITLEDYHCLNKIRAQDLSSKVNNVEGAQYSASVKALVTRSSQLAVLVRKEIESTDAAAASKALSHWGNVVLKLKNWNNWHSIYAIASALGPSLDNQRLWPPGSDGMRNGLRGFYASTLADYSLDSLKADLRAAMKNAPGIPYLTPLLVEIQMLEVLLFTDEYIDEPQKVINFDRLRAMNELLTGFMTQQQRTPYRFNAVPLIQSWLGLTSVAASPAPQPATTASPASAAPPAGFTAAPARKVTVGQTRPGFAIGQRPYARTSGDSPGSPMRRIESAGAILSAGTPPPSTTPPTSSSAFPPAASHPPPSQPNSVPPPSSPSPSPFPAPTPIQVTTAVPAASSAPGTPTSNAQPGASPFGVRRPPPGAVAVMPLVTGVNPASRPGPAVPPKRPSKASVGAGADAPAEAAAAPLEKNIWRSQEKVANILVAGWPGVGRKALVGKLAGGAPLPSSDESAVVEVKGVAMRFIIPAMTPQQTLNVAPHLEGLSGCLLVYDISKATSANGLFSWWKAANTAKIPTILVGTHSDLPRQIPPGSVAGFASQHGMKAMDFCYTNETNVSALGGLLVEGVAPFFAAKASKETKALQGIGGAVDPPSAQHWPAILEYINALEVIAAKAGAGALPPRPPGI